MENSGEEIIDQLRQRVEEDAQRKSEEIRASMFSKNHNTQNFQQPVNIFANNKKPETKNLFTNEKKSINLFQMQDKGGVNLFKANEQGAKNIFDTTQKPAIEDKEEDQSLSEASESAIKSQHTFKTDPEVKQMRYQYKNQLQKIGQFQLQKFKNGISPAKDDIYVTMEKSSEKSGILYLFVRNNSTKISVYQGIMMKNISNPQHFMGKEDNIRFEVLKQNRNEKSPESETGKNSKLMKQLVKLQFVSIEQCNNFLKAVSENL